MTARVWSDGPASAAHPTKTGTVKARRDRLDAAIEQVAGDSEFTPLVRRVACLRGISTLTAFALAVEIGDWTRFTPKAPSCGNQPAHISLTARRQRHVHHQRSDEARSRRRGPPRRRLTMPP
jgi:hypothetical protein